VYKLFSAEYQTPLINYIRQRKMLTEKTAAVLHFTSTTVENTP